jgi:hypothetical protein
MMRALRKVPGINFREPIGLPNLLNWVIQNPAYKNTAHN